MLELKQKPARSVLTDMVGDAPFNLKSGEWTNDIAIALTLCDWLANDADLDPADLMSRFVRWYESGEYSYTGTCFDIGNATRAAPDHFITSGEALAGSTNPRSAGNGALMKLAPVAIRFWMTENSLLKLLRFKP